MTSTPGPGTPQSMGSSDEYSGVEASEREAELIESKSEVSPSVDYERFHVVNGRCIESNELRRCQE